MGRAGGAAMWVGLVAALAVAPSARPDEAGPAPARGIIETCLGEADDPPEQRACIGTVAGPCLAASPAGDTVAGVIACAESEAVVWAALLDEAYEGLVLASRGVAEIDIEAGLPVGHREETLQAAQRAWIAFRDADCAHAVAAYGATGAGRSVAAWCRLGHDAERALALRARLSQFGE